MFVLKIRSEETEIRSELILATPTSRVKYFLGYAAIAVISAVLLQTALTLGLYSVASGTLPDAGELPLSFLLESNLVYIPALWAMAGIAALVVGLAPRLTGAVWGYFAFAFFVSFVGRLPGVLPSWAGRLTPLGFVPQLPMESTNPAVLAALTAIAAALIALGCAFYKRRDINAVTR